MRSPRVYGDIDRMWFLEAAKAERKRLSRRRNRKSKASQKRKRSKQKRSRASVHSRRNRRFRGEPLNEHDVLRKLREPGATLHNSYSFEQVYNWVREHVKYNEDSEAYEIDGLAGHRLGLTDFFKDVEFENDKDIVKQALKNEGMLGNKTRRSSESE